MPEKNYSVKLTFKDRNIQQAFVNWVFEDANFLGAFAEYLENSEDYTKDFSEEVGSNSCNLVNYMEQRDVVYKVEKKQ